VVARLKAAGAVITGKTSIMEFAIGMPDESKEFRLEGLPRRRGGRTTSAVRPAAR
jgi:aspartyl-tRNA(Asn)/glutamyl-tRNA(Gln) amidotransferase subunit A